MSTNYEWRNTAGSQWVSADFETFILLYVDGRSTHYHIARKKGEKLFQGLHYNVLKSESTDLEEIKDWVLAQADRCHPSWVYLGGERWSSADGFIKIGRRGGHYRVGTASNKGPWLNETQHVTIDGAFRDAVRQHDEIFNG